MKKNRHYLSLFLSVLILCISIAVCVFAGQNETLPDTVSNQTYTEANLDLPASDADTLEANVNDVTTITPETVESNAGSSENTGSSESNAPTSENNGSGETNVASSESAGSGEINTESSENTGSSESNTTTPETNPDDMMSNVDMSPTTPDGMEPSDNFSNGVTSLTNQNTLQQTEGSNEPVTEKKDETQESDYQPETSFVPVNPDELTPETNPSEVKTGKVVITKYVMGENGYRLEEGVEYIFHKSGIVEDQPLSGQTDKDGNLEIEVPVGTYDVEEKGIDSTARSSTFKITVEEEETQYIRVVGQQVYSNHLIKVVDTETKEPVEGVTLNFYKGDLKITFKDPLSEELVENLITDENGIIHLYESINSTDFSISEGELGYKIISVPAGYAVSDDVVLFKAEKSDIENGQYLLEIGLEYAKGSIEISAKDNTSEANLPGVSYLVYADEDIRIADGNMAYAKGDTVAELVTDENGLARLENLPEGRYAVVQRSMYNGYVFLQEVKYLAISREEKALRVNFSLTPTTITVNVTNIINSVDVVGIKFAYRMENGATKEIQTDGNGHFVISGLSTGVWTLNQVTTPVNTTMDTNIYSFIVDDNGYINGKTAEYINITLQRETVTQTPVVENSILKVSIVDAKDGSVIPKSGFEILSESGQIVANGVMQDGAVELKDLATGNYKVRQTVAGNGYVISAEEYYVELNIDREVVIQNNRVYGYLEIHKLTSTQMAGVKGVKYVLMDANGNELEVVETNEEGKAFTGNYPIGTYENGVMTAREYKLQEKAVASGYKEDSRVYNIKFDYLNSSTPLVYIRIRIPAFAQAAAVSYITGNGSSNDALSTGSGSTGYTSNSGVVTSNAGNTGAATTGNANSIEASRTGLTDKLPLLGIGFLLMVVSGSGFLVLYLRKRKRMRRAIHKKRK